ncbi:hypothetical protein GCM10022291_12280 [Postechiella marina]|uniref:4-alpha-L-fucosyltransferase n=1 Tax=Postechiella marina TaxID=943941 RepID=A0ABP8C5A2_9FLAO
MILHVIDDEKFLVSVIELFETIFPNQNIFLVGIDKVGYNDFEKLEQSTKVIFKNINTPSYQTEYLELSKSVNFILFHNVYKTYKLRLLQKYKLNIKTAWTFWGAEMYGLNPNYNALLPATKTAYLKSLSIKDQIKKTTLSKLKKAYYWRLFKNALRQRKLHYTLTNINADVDLLESYTKLNLPRGWFSYYYYNDAVRSKIKTDKKNILIGNSSSESNNHLDAFNLINKKELKDKKIYVPLNYGDKKYKDLVIKQAKGIFGSSVEPLVDFLSLNEYTFIINSCSVLILNHKRQQAFNTIMLALANGCKVYLREENTIYKTLKSEGFIISSIQKNINSKEALNALTKEEQKYNLELINKHYSKNIVFERIKVEFERMINE